MLKNRSALLPAALAAFALSLAACSGGGMSSSQSMLPSTEAQRLVAEANATPMPSTIVLAAGATIGTDNEFVPSDGDTSAGGQGQTIDGIACPTSMVENSYHVHAFVGVLVNGVQYAIPDGIGMESPGADVNGYTNSAKCFYSIHTHDASGMIHIEAKSSAPLSSSIYKLGNLLDIWGQPVSSTRFARWTGPIHVFYATTALRSTYSGTYKAFTGDMHTIPLYSHEAIWIEIGSIYRTAAQLPRIRFYTEY